MLFHHNYGIVYLNWKIMQYHPDARNVLRENLKLKYILKIGNSDAKTVRAKTSESTPTTEKKN